MIPEMLEVGWYGVILDSLHAHEIVSEMWPHSLEISILGRRHMLEDVGTLWNWSSIDVLVDLHVKGEQSRLGLVLDETFNILKLLVLVIWSADGANLELVSCLGLSDNILTSQVLVMDILLVLAALMVPSEDVLLAMNSIALPQSKDNFSGLFTFQVVAPVAHNSILSRLVNKCHLSLNFWFIRVRLVLNAPQRNQNWCARLHFYFI